MVPVDEGQGVAGKLEELFRVYAKLFHARQKSGPINAYAHCSSVSATDATFGFLQNTHDFVPLLLIVLVTSAFRSALRQGTDRFFNYPGYILTG